MGRQRRPVPKLLAKKLKRIRVEHGWTQQQMAKELGRVPSAPDSAMISRYERGEREPSLLVLLAYAQRIGTTVDVLIDDRITVENLARMMQ